MKNIQKIFNINSVYYLQDERTGTRKRVYYYNIKHDVPFIRNLNNLSFNQIPIYKTTAFNVGQSNYNINNDPVNLSYISGNLPAKYLADCMFQQKSINSFQIGTNKFIAGNLLLKDLNSEELLVLGTIDRKFLDIKDNRFENVRNNSGKVTVISEENYKKLEEELKQRKNPIKIYISNSLFTKPEYKNLQKEILYFIQKINENKYIPVIITNNILSQVKVGYQFPKFATIDEMEDFLTKVLSKTIENIKT